MKKGGLQSFPEPVLPEPVLPEPPPLPLRQSSRAVLQSDNSVCKSVILPFKASISLFFSFITILAVGDKDGFSIVVRLCERLVEDTPAFVPDTSGMVPSRCALPSTDVGGGSRRSAKVFIFIAGFMAVVCRKETRFDFGLRWKNWARGCSGGWIPDFGLGRAQRVWKDLPENELASSFQSTMLGVSRVIVFRQRQKGKHAQTLDGLT